MTDTATVEELKQREVPTERVEAAKLAAWGIQLHQQRMAGNAYANVILTAIGARAELQNVRALDAFNEAYLVLVPEVNKLLAELAEFRAKDELDDRLSLLCTNFVFGCELDTPLPEDDAA